MAITPLPTPPSRTSPSDFSTKADAFIAALPVFVAEANAQAAALELNSTTANSTTSLAIGTGSKSLTVDLAKSYQPGMSVKIARTSSPSNWMHGDVTSYNAGTGALVVNVLDILGSGTYTDWTVTFSAPNLLVQSLIYNLKPYVNAAVNKLDIFTKSGGAAPDGTNIIKIAIPDGNGYTLRSRAAAYLSGTGQIIMADAANYWSKGSLDAEIKTAWLYAIWDGTGIVWALGGYSGFTMVSTTTTATDDDYFLLEASSTYTRDNAHYCVAVAKIRYQYDTGDGPDHTIQATVENAPQVIWNPKSDYGYTKSLATQNLSGSNIADYSCVSVVVKQSGKFRVHWQISALSSAAAAAIGATIKTGSSTYGSATVKGTSVGSTAAGPDEQTVSAHTLVYLNTGDTIHGGGYVNSASGNRTIRGDNTVAKATLLSFQRED